MRCDMGAGFFIHASNRMERLAQALCDVIASAPLPALLPETIIVQSRGMERWISMRLADRLGVWTNCLFPFPNAFVDELFARAFPRESGQSDFDPDTLCLRIMKMLPTLLNDPEFGDLKDYCFGAGDLKLYQLCAKIADVFDQYTIYRQELLRSWENNEERSWQALLWRLLVKESKGMHRSRLADELSARLAAGTFTPLCAGRRISVFGIASLPPFHCEILRRLSAFCDVHLFLLNPCREYWEDIVSDRELSSLIKKETKPPGNVTDLHFEKGNSLLASLGTYGRDFYALLWGRDFQETWHPVEPGDATMLQTVQSDIFHLTDRGKDTDDPRLPRREKDLSIQFHSCHSVMREVEVLYDNLLALFEKIPGLLPSDIVVMMPDIETYAPYIHAVFGADVQGLPAIPYSLSDRSSGADSAVTEAFFSILSLCKGRFKAGDVLSLLGQSCIRQAFSLGEDEAALIARWVADTNIRWGIDENDRRRLGLPAFSQNTWQSGLDMMLAGFAMRRSGFDTFKGIAPCDAVEGGSDVLAKLLEFFSRLSKLAASLGQKHSFEEWSAVLLDAANAFLSAETEELPKLQLLRSAIMNIGQTARQAGYADAVDLDAAVAMFSSSLSLRKSSAGFLNGQVTFCSMMPMRSIPFRVLCMLGMNDDAFPRKSLRIGWNMISRKPQKGDRSLEKEDRYLFLESILSCRDVLYISYIGRNIRDNTETNPSVVVSELMDYLDAAFSPSPAADAGDSVLSRIMFKHRLQAFSAKYFEPSQRLFSYSRENYRAAASAGMPKSGARPFFDTPLSSPPDEWRNVTLSDLIRFFSHPSKFLLEKRLGIYLAENGRAAADTEPLSIEGLQRYSISQELLDAMKTGSTADECFDYFNARGVLPHGSVGVCEYSGLSAEIAAFVKRLEHSGVSPSRMAEPFDLAINEFKLSGTIDRISPAGVAQYRYADAKAKDHISLWINHCSLCALSQVPNEITSYLFAKDGNFKYKNVANAQAVLAGLLDLYFQGLSRPLHFFPETSWSFSEAMLEKGENRSAALARCRRQWDINEFTKAESDDPYHRLSFGGFDPLDGQFETASLSVFTQLFESMEGFDI